MIRLNWNADSWFILSVWLFLNQIWFGKGAIFPGRLICTVLAFTEYIASERDVNPDLWLVWSKFNCFVLTIDSASVRL